MSPLITCHPASQVQEVGFPSRYSMCVTDSPQYRVPVSVYHLCTASLYLCTTSLYLCTASLYLEKVVSSKQLKFVMETDVERKARLEKMVATQLRLALETEEERRAKKGMNQRVR